MDFTTQILLRLSAAIFLCIVFFRLVMRGRWIVWSHPICSACGFNLQGLPETSTNCPECGGELVNVRKNTVWRRRWISLSLAVVLTFICGSILVSVAPHFIDRAPSFVLIGFKQYPPAMNVLEQRLARDELSDSQKIAVLEEMIRSPNWMNARSIEFLRGRGSVVPDSIWKKHAEQSLDLRISLRPTIARGDPLVIQVQSPWRRFSNLTMLKITHKLRIRIDSSEVPIPVPTAIISGMYINEPFNEIIPIPDDLQARLTDGAHRIQIDAMGEAADNTKPDVVLAKRTTSSDMVMNLLPRGKSSVTLVKADDERTKPHQPRNCSVTIYRDGNFPELEGNMDKWLPRFDRYSYQLIVRQDGREVTIGSMMVGPGEFFWVPVKPPPALRLAPCDVIFRPDPEAAKLTISLDKIVDEEFVVKDAQVRPDRDAGR